jgi:hypothetical protein
VLFPDVKIPRQYKLKEHHVREYLMAVFDQRITMAFDKRVDQGCSARRPDVFIDFGSHILVIECDEHQHKGYSCENKRMMEIFHDAGNRPAIFLRFNPDAYQEGDKKHPGCFRPTKTVGLKVQEEFTRRMHAIVARIRHFQEQVPEREVTVEHWFYDS